MPYALKMSKGNRQDAEDLIQTTILKIINKKDNFKNHDNFLGWAYIIMKNTYLTEITVNNRFQKTSIDDYINNIKDTQVQNQYDLNYLENIVSSLPDKYKIPFEMFVNGYKYCEISDKLKLNIDTVKSRISRARIKLKKQIYI